MSLQNLVRIGSLVEQAPDPAEVARRLDAASRSLADAAHSDLSPESRFDLAYKAVMHCAIAALRARGYRLSTSQPGHHQTAIQTLILTVEFERTRTHALDAMRRKRNGIDYEADSVSDSMAQSCIAEATYLLEVATRAIGPSP